MRLNAVACEGTSAGRWLVFLHGFSGDNREWQTVGEKLTGYSRLYIDLPGHGGSADISVTHFEDVFRLLGATLASFNISHFWLVGYSLGGRIAMYAAAQGLLPGLKGLIVEGSHPGLQNETCRRERHDSDSQWAQRFRCEPLNVVFDAWYRQPVFASLSEEQRKALVALRADNNGSRLADMLLATSLAVQPDLSPNLTQCNYPFWYLSGERDAKFRVIAEQLQVPCYLISNAGHNAHRENPEAVAGFLTQILND